MVVASQRVSKAGMSDLVWFGIARILIRRLLDTYGTTEMLKD